MDDFKARILAAKPGEIVELPEGWTFVDLVAFVADGGLDDELEEASQRLLFTEAPKVRKELH